MSEGIDFSVFDNAVKKDKKPIDFSSFDEVLKKKPSATESADGSIIPIVPLDKQGLETPSTKLSRDVYKGFILEPSNYISTPKVGEESFDPIEKQQFAQQMQTGAIKTPKEKDLIVSNIIANRTNPVVKYNNGKAFLEQDIDNHTQIDNLQNFVLNPASLFTRTTEDLKKDIIGDGESMVDGRIPSISYANARKAQIDQQIADLKHAQYTTGKQLTGRQAGANIIPVENFNELQGKIDELTAYKNDLTNFTDPVAKVQVYSATKETPPDPNNPSNQVYNHWGDIVATRTPEESKYMNIGMNYTSLYEPITVENKKKSLESGADKNRNNDIVAIENYGYEKQGILTSIEALDILHSEGKVEQQSYEAERGKLLQANNDLIKKYPQVRMQNIKGALGQILDKNRDVDNAIQGQTGIMKSLWQNIVNTGYSNSEVQDAIKELNDKGADISKKEAEFLINNKSDIGNTSLLGRAIGGTVKLENKLEATAGLQSDAQYENAQHLLETHFANTPNKAPEQPQSVISTEGDIESNPDFLQPVKNPDAGLHNWGWGTVNLVADGVGTLAKLYALTELTGGVADELVGGTFGTDVVGYSAAPRLGKIVEQTALSGAQRQTIGTIAGMYLDTYQDAKEAAKTFIGDEQGGEGAREMYANLMGLANGVAWTILPANKIVQDIASKAATVGAEDFAKLIPAEGIAGLKENTVADFLTNTLKNTAEAQGKITGIGALTQVSQYAAQAMYNPQSVESRNLGQEITDGALQGLSFLPITLLEGRGVAKNIEKVNDFQKEAIYRVSSDPVAFKNFTENEVNNGNLIQPEANAKIQLVNTMFEIRSREVPDDLTKPEKIEYANNLLYTKKLHQENETIKDPVQTKKNEEKIAELEKRRQEILDNSTGKIPVQEEIKNTPVTETKTEINAAEVVDSLKDNENVPSFEFKAMQDNPEDALKGIADQALGFGRDEQGNRQPLSETANEPQMEAVVRKYGKEVVDKAIEKYPAESISSQSINNNEQKSNSIKESNLQGGRTEGQHNELVQSGEVQGNNAKERKPGQEVGNNTASEKSGAVSTLTPEAQDLLTSIGEGSQPTFITKNLEKIAKDNGIEITDKMTADDVINALKEKQSKPTDVVGSEKKEDVAQEIAMAIYPDIGSKEYNEAGRNKILGNPLEEVDRMINFYENDQIPKLKKSNSSLLPLSEKSLEKLKDLKEKYLTAQKSENKPIVNEEPKVKVPNPETKTGSSDAEPPKTPPTAAEATASKDENFTAVRKEKLREIEGAKELFEKREKKKWSEIYDTALKNIQKKYPNKSLYEAMKTEVREQILKLNNKELYNPTSEDIAVFNVLRAETHKRIDAIEGLDSDNNIVRQTAIAELENLNNDLLDIARVTNPNGEAGRAFGMLQSEVNTNNGLKIRRMQLMKAKGGEPLTEAEMKWTEEKWEQEKALMKEEEQVRTQKMQEEFDNRISELQKEYEQKLKEAGSSKSKKDKEKTLSQSGKDVADKIRKLKLTGTKVDFTLGTWNVAVEGIAKLVEGGATIAEAIEKLVKDGVIGFKEQKDKDNFENRLFDWLSNKKDKQQSLDAIKEFAKETDVTDITADMVKDNLIRDYVNSHVGEVDKKEIFNTAFNDLKEVLPNITKERFTEAYLKEGEFKQPTKRQLEEGIKEQENTIKRIVRQELSADQKQKIKLGAEKENAISKTREYKRKLTDGEFEEPLPTKLNKKDAELIRLKKEQSVIEEQYRKKQKELQEKNKHWLERVADLIRSSYVALLIGRPLTLAKVAAMSVLRPTSEAATKLSFGKVFDYFFPNISKAALRGGESSSIKSIQQGFKAYFAQMGEKKMEEMYQKKNKAYEDAKAEYEKYKNSSSPDEKKLKTLQDNVNQKLIDATGSFIYKFIGGSSIKDALTALVNRSNEIERQFGKVEGEKFDTKGLKDVGGSSFLGLNADNARYILDFIGRSHSAVKTFSGRFSFAAGFMARLEGAVRNGEDISSGDKILEIAHESYLDWERGKYQQSNAISDLWNKIVNNISKGETDQSKINTGKAMETLLKGDVAITRVPVNILHESVMEYTLGAFRAAVMAYKGIKQAKGELREAGMDINSPEFKQALKDKISQMDEKQAATIARAFRKGGLGIGLYALALISGAIHFGIFPHLGQKKKKEESDLKPGELNPGDIMVGDARMNHNVASIVEHIPALWPTLMGLGMAQAYHDEINNGKTTAQAVAKTIQTHLQIIEGGIPQTQIVSPSRVAGKVFDITKKRLEDSGVIDSDKTIFTNEELKGNDTINFLKEKGIEFKPPTSAEHKIDVDEAHPNGRMMAEELDKFKTITKDAYLNGVEKVEGENEQILSLDELLDATYTVTVKKKDGTKKTKTIAGRELPEDQLQTLIESYKKKVTEYADKQLALKSEKDKTIIKKENN